MNEHTPSAAQELPPLIQLEECSFAYPGKGQVLANVSFSVPQGALFLLAGVNGSGKSTLLQLLAGLHAPSSGKAVIAGNTMPKGQRAVRRMAALCLQEPDLQILGATPREDLELCLHKHADPAPALEMADRFGIAHCLDTPVHTLSHGQKRKLCLATALLTQELRGKNTSALLLLDEPVSGLDYPAIIELRELLQDNKNRGVTQVVVSHDLEPLLDLADFMGLLADGRLLHLGTAEAVLPHARECGVRPPCRWNPDAPAAPIPPWE